MPECKVLYTRYLSLPFNLKKKIARKRVITIVQCVFRRFAPTSKTWNREFSATNQPSPQLVIRRVGSHRCPDPMVGSRKRIGQRNRRQTRTRRPTTEALPIRPILPRKVIKTTFCKTKQNKTNFFLLIKVKLFPRLAP